MVLGCHRSCLNRVDGGRVERIHRLRIVRLGEGHSHTVAERQRVGFVASVQMIPRARQPVCKLIVQVRGGKGRLGEEMVRRTSVASVQPALLSARCGPEQKTTITVPENDATPSRHCNCTLDTIYYCYWYIETTHLMFSHWERSISEPPRTAVAAE